MALVPFDPECVYYDIDLKSLSKAFDDMSKAFKLIKKRAERAQTQRVDKSYFDYVSKRQALDVVPQTFYDFRIDDVRICIYRYKKDYFILCVNCDFPWLSTLDGYKGVGLLKGFYKTWQDAVPDYLRCVQHVSQVLAARFCPDDVPF